MNIPSFFSEKETILSFDYSQINKYINSSIDKSFFIPNLSPPDDRHNLCSEYLKSILQGYNHIYISKILENLNNPSANICLPLLNQWNEKTILEDIYNFINLFFVINLDPCCVS